MMPIVWSSLEKQIGQMTAEETMDLFEYLWGTTFSETQRELFIERHTDKIRDMLPEED